MKMTNNLIGIYPMLFVDGHWAFWLFKRKKNVDISDVRFFTYDGKLVRIEQSPHFKFFSALAKAEDKKNLFYARKYIGYMNAQYGYSKNHLRQRLERSFMLFQRMSNEINDLAIVAVKNKSNGKLYNVVDGFHRAAILKALGASKVNILQVYERIQIRKDSYFFRLIYKIKKILSG
jgi:hypothetical protein